jgi:hypothetical protein
MLDDLTGRILAARKRLGSRSAWFLPASLMDELWAQATRNQTFSLVPPERDRESGQMLNEEVYFEEIP